MTSHTAHELRELIASVVSEQIAPVAQDCRSIHEKVEANAAAISKIDRFITGSGDPERGATIRLDRLEQSEKSRKFWTNTAIGAAVAAFVAAIWDLLTK